MLCAFPLLINLANNSHLASLSRGSSTVPLELPKVAVTGLAAGWQGSLGTQPHEATLRGPAYVAQRGWLPCCGALRSQAGGCHRIADWPSQLRLDPGHRDLMQLRLAEGDSSGTCIKEPR